MEYEHVNYGHGGWSGPGLTKAKKAETCNNTYELGKTLPEKVQKIIQIHGKIIWWWAFIPRLDQYWGMFSPDPLNNDYWLVIDADIVAED